MEKRKTLLQYHEVCPVPSLVALHNKQFTQNMFLERLPASQNYFANSKKGELGMTTPVRSGTPGASSGLSSDPEVLAQQLQVLRLQKEILELQNAQRQEPEIQVKQTPSGTDKTNLLKMQLDDLASRERMLDFEISSARQEKQKLEMRLQGIPGHNRIGDTAPNYHLVHTLNAHIALQTKILESFEQDKIVLRRQRIELGGQIQGFCSPPGAMREEPPRETMSARKRRLDEEAQTLADNQRAQQESQEADRKMRQEARARQNLSAKNNPYRTGNVG